MIYVSIAIVLAILAAVIIFITRPFFSTETEEESPETTAPDSLSEMLGEEEYQGILKRIRELDFDFQLGKVSAEDHALLREELKQAAADCLQREREDSVEVDLDAK